MHSPQIVAEAGPTALELVANVLPVQRPAEIVNYKSMGTMPVILAAGVAAGAVAGLGLALVASVRRRRRDLALLKTLGFTRRQLAATIAWQSTVIAAGGCHRRRPGRSRGRPLAVDPVRPFLVRRA